MAPCRHRDDLSVIAMKGKTIFITGGNDGIGLGVAMLFAQEGANVAILCRRADANESAKEKLVAAGADISQLLTVEGDVCSEEDVKRALAATMARFGALHFAFNNAATDEAPVAFTDQSSAEFDRVMATNVKSVWLCMKYELPLIEKSQGGCIVNTSSHSGHRGIQLPLYTASKHAVIGLTRAAALEYGPRKIRVNAVCPGVIQNTGLYEKVARINPDLIAPMIEKIPAGRMGIPGDIAACVLYLCRDAVWTTGQYLIVDGGQSIG